ncbi:MAG: hypothetical protein AABX14_05770 [Candidatus Aenigmatarchaeota archaeon]
MKTANIFKTRNFAESGEFNKNPRCFHITDFCAERKAFAQYARTSGSMQFWVNPKNDESRVFAKESRDMISGLESIYIHQINMN